MPYLHLHTCSPETQCFREICVFQRWPEGEPNLDEFPVGDSDTLRFDQRTGSPL